MKTCYNNIIAGDVNSPFSVIWIWMWLQNNQEPLSVDFIPVNGDQSS